MGWGEATKLKISRRYELGVDSLLRYSLRSCNLYNETVHLADLIEYFIQDNFENYKSAGLILCGILDLIP